MQGLIQGLNAEQAEAVRTVRGPVLVLAGAGSGKTRVITIRIASLVRMGILPDHILAVTFTNKASREMAERLAGILSGDVASRVTVSTFHKLGVQVLKEFGGRVGLKREFSILDSDDQVSLVRECMREAKVSLERYEPQWIQGRISALKNAGVKPGTQQLRLTDVIGNLIERVYVLYQRSLDQMGAVDFDDLLLKPLHIMQSCPDVLEKLRDRYRFIHVDEFQDTNGVQMEMIKSLTLEHRNLCVVGDDDQSIYAWRGARMENVLGFEREFPEAKLIKLTQNYRSSGAILEAANAVIKNNKTRREKELWTASEYGQPLRYRRVETPEQEADFIVNELLRLKVTRPLKSGDVGILFRANSQARVIEQALRVASIRYKVIGGMTFFDRKEIKDAMAYLKWIVNPDDELALRKVLSFPQRGVGEGSILKLLKAVRDQKTSIGNYLRDFSSIPGLHRRGETALRQLGELLKLRVRIEGDTGDAVSGFVEVLEKVGFRQGLWQAAKTRDEGERKWDNVEEFLTAFRRFADKRKGAVKGSDFLQEISLTQQDDGEDEDRVPVLLMSLHASKGLEFPIVFLPGLEEKLLPHWRSLETGDVSEERRLFYVGITRAREELYLSACRVRQQYRKTLQCKASRFLEELPDGIVEQGRQEQEWSEEDAHQAAMDQLAYLFQDDSDESEG